MKGHKQQPPPPDDCAGADRRNPGKREEEDGVGCCRRNREKRPPLRFLGSGFAPRRRRIISILLLTLPVAVDAVTGRGPHACNRGANCACAPIPNNAEGRCHPMPFSRRAASSIAASPDPRVLPPGPGAPAGLVPAVLHPPVAPEVLTWPSAVHHRLGRDGGRPPGAGSAGLDLPAVVLRAGRPGRQGQDPRSSRDRAGCGEGGASGRPPKRAAPDRRFRRRRGHRGLVPAR